MQVNRFSIAIKHILFLAVFLCISSILFGQRWQTRQDFSVQGDFGTAVEITDSIIRITEVNRGNGNRLDFDSSKRFYEHNSNWFKFYIRKDTILTFDIIPENGDELYDFTLFKCEGKNCADELKSKDFEPVRKSFFATNGAVGLTRNVQLKNIPNGKRPGYVEALPVKAGELYYLIINLRNRVYETEHPKGYTIYFYNYWPERLAYLKVQKTSSQTIVLTNLLFKNNDTELLPESNQSLNKLVKQLKDNRKMMIEINGHSDNTGSLEKNQILSEGRAKSVVDYLVSKGIAASRLTYRGFGSAKPIATNETEDGRMKNRRVEFRIIHK